MYVYMYVIIIIQVIAFVCDGAKPNRKFMKTLGVKEHMKNGITYKTVNRYCRDRFIYLICDVPHLIKTTRNCWYSSTFSGTRCMWVCVTLCFDIQTIIVTLHVYICNRERVNTFCGIT